MKISNKEKVRLDKIAKQNKVTSTEAMKVYKEEYDKLVSKGVTENIERFAVSAVLNNYRRYMGIWV